MGLDFYQGQGILAVVGSLYNSGLISVAAGELVVAGSLYNNGEINFNYGQDPGPSEVYFAGSLNGSGTLSAGSVVNENYMVLSGRVGIGANGEFGGVPASNAGVTLTNTGQISFRNAYAYLSGSSGTLRAASTIVNHGAFRLSGAGGNGANAWGSSTLVSSGAITSSEYFLISGGYPGGQGSKLVNFGGTFVSAGELKISGGQASGTGGSFYNSVSSYASLGSTTQIYGGSSGASSYSGFGLGGQITNAGTLVNGSNAFLSIFTGSARADGVGGSGGTLTDNGVMTNAGHVRIEPFATAGGSALSTGGSGVLLVNGSFTNTSSGEIYSAGSLGGSGSLTNYGTITDGSATTGVVSTTSFTNDGTVSVGGGDALSVSSSYVSGIGDFLIGSNGGLSFGNVTTIASGQTVDLGGGALTLNDPFAFNGLLDSITNSSTIDLPTQTAVSASYTTTELFITLSGGGTLSLAAHNPSSYTPTIGNNGHQITFSQGGPT